MSITNFDTSQKWLTTLNGTSAYIAPSMLLDIFTSISNDLSGNINNLILSLSNYTSLIDKRNNLQKLVDTITKNSNQITNSNTIYQNSNTTNNRKSYYEGQQYDNLLTIYSSLLWIYYVVGIIIIVVIFVADTTLSISYRIGISVIIMLYPFIVNLIVKPMMYLYNFIYGMMPNNVYNNI